jgi:hypothetical protein
VGKFLFQLLEIDFSLSDLTCYIFSFRKSQVVWKIEKKMTDLAFLKKWIIKLPAVIESDGTIAPPVVNVPVYLKYIVINPLVISINNIILSP